MDRMTLFPFIQRSPGDIGDNDIEQDDIPDEIVVNEIMVVSYNHNPPSKKNLVDLNKSR